MTDLKSSAASASMNLHCEGGSLFNLAFSRADMMEALEISIPIEVVKSEERVMVKSPEPEYASIKYLILGWLEDSDSGGII